MVAKYFYASDSKGVELIEREYEIRKRHKLPVELLNKDELHKRYKLETYAGALLNRRSAQLDAYKAATKLFQYHIEKITYEYSPTRKSHLLKKHHWVADWKHRMAGSSDVNM